jgi:hypothetical protein
VTALENLPSTINDAHVICQEKEMEGKIYVANENVEQHWIDHFEFLYHCQRLSMNRERIWSQAACLLHNKSTKILPCVYYVSYLTVEEQQI